MAHQKTRLSTLENPLLYRNFLKALERSNPDIEVDPDEIDRTLEYDEAFNELKEIYPGLRISSKERSGLQHNLVYIDDVKEGPLISWLQRFGLSKQEAARIQPGYEGPNGPVLGIIAITIIAAAIGLFAFRIMRRSRKLDVEKE